MKSETASHGRSARTQRRQADRARAKGQHRQERKPNYSLWVGGAIIPLFLIGAILYTLMHSHAAGSAKTGLTNPADLAPVPSLVAAGQKAPNFTLKTTSGRAYSLAAQRGHPVLIEFFADWCPVCHAEAPTIARLTKNYAPKGVTVWSILANPYGPNYETSGQTDLTLATAADLADYARTYKVRHPQLVDPTFKITNEYGVSAYPGLYIINPNGTVAYSTAGRQPYNVLARALDKALKRHA